MEVYRRLSLSMRIATYLQLFLFQGGTNITLKPVILPEILQEAKARVREVVAREKHAPIEHMKLYDKYEALITKQVHFSCIAAFKLDEATKN